MEQKAQGFIEVTGYVPAIEVADAMAKAADVVIAMAHKVDGPRVCVICEGDVAACKAAVDAGESLARSKNQFIACNVIPRPEQGAGALYGHMNDMRARKAAKKAEKDARRKGLSASPAAAETSAAKTAKRSR